MIPIAGSPVSLASRSKGLSLESRGGWGYATVLNMFTRCYLVWLQVWLSLVFVVSPGWLQAGITEPQFTGVGRSLREFGVASTNTAELNRDRLQSAIDWAAARGGAIWVEPTEDPYPMAGGLVLRMNASLIGVHGPVGRGTRHPGKVQPVGSVFRIEDEERVFLTVESATQIRGIQFWYPKQTLSDPGKIIAYPATIQVSRERSAQGVTLSCLTFYGEYRAMDFRSDRRFPCEQILVEHCYGYPVSGEFFSVDYCYDIPRVLHCHVNPANRRFIDGGYSRQVIDAVVSAGTYTYSVDHTDNAVLMDLFTFGAYGGVRLGPATYGQLTSFNLDCVTVGIWKQGDGTFNRNWQIAQGSIIANTGAKVEEVHPIIVEGQGHTTLSQVEAFSGPNAALSTLNRSQDFVLVRGDRPLTLTLFGCRMRNYIGESPLTLQNSRALVRAVGCIDGEENLFEGTWQGSESK